MKSLILLMFSFVFIITAFTHLEGEQRLKLAIMEFEDRSETLDQTMLSNAAEYLRSEFVGSDQFIVIAKERQEKTLIKEMKKESYQICKDKSCQIPLGQALSADTILRTTINYFGGVYTITAELIDLAKEATVKGAKFQFDGSEQGLMQAMDRITVQLAGTASSYEPENLKDDKVSVGVELGGVELTVLPTVDVAVVKIEDVTKHETVQKLESINLADVAAGIDVLEAYDKAVKADKNGLKDPERAMQMWKELSEIKEENPFREKASERYIEWFVHINLKGWKNQFETAIDLENYGELFPELVIEAWKEIIKTEKVNPYYGVAQKKLDKWQTFLSQITKYKQQQKDFGKQRLKDIEKIQRALQLDVLSNSKKRSIMIKYIELYAPFYGVDDIHIVFSLIGKEKTKKLMELLYNDYLYKEMQEKCTNGQAGGCYIYAALTQVEKPAQSLEYFEKACDQGIVDGCIKAGKAIFETNKKKSFQHFYNACRWESPEGCHITAFMMESGIGTIRSESAAKKLFNKACHNNYKISCKMYENMVEYGYSSDQAKQIIEKRNDEKTALDTSVKNGDFVKESKITRFDDATMTVQVKEKYFPYKWQGITLSIVGTLIAVGGGTGFNSAAKKQYDDYLSLTTDEKIGEAVISGKSRVEYLDEMKKYKDKGDIYRTISIVSGVTGGIIAVGGIVLAVIPRERTVFKRVGLYIDEKSFYASLRFDFN